MESPALLALEQKIASVARITPEGFRLLLSRGRRRPLARGENVLAEGQVARHIYFVESGYLRCFYNKDGKEINLQQSGKRHRSNGFRAAADACKASLPHLARVSTRAR